ncbi:MAG: preprotein translocase subunit Sec61beta [Candidatus Nanohaloarchaea archaeon]|nr:preprotein translocase subunit Sec61beta [Candidatus Nanohaloarchaea archaeon]
MAKKEQQQMPSSFGGLVRYFDEGEAKFQLDPKVIVAVIVGLITLELVAKFSLGL